MACVQVAYRSFHSWSDELFCFLPAPERVQPHEESNKPNVATPEVHAAVPAGVGALILFRAERKKLVNDHMFPACK